MGSSSQLTCRVRGRSDDKAGCQQCGEGDKVAEQLHYDRNEVIFFREEEQLV